MITPTGNIKIAGFLISAALHPGDGHTDPETTDVRDLGRILYATVVSRWPGGPAHGLPAARAERVDHDAGDDAARDGQPAGAGQDGSQQEHPADADHDEGPVDLSEQPRHHARGEEKSAQDDQQKTPNNTLSIIHFKCLQNISLLV